MSTKYTGGFITKSPVAPTTSAASGIWTLDQQQQAQKAGTWPSPPVFIEDLFSTYLYTGTGSAQTITNNIDITGKGALVWIKNRISAESHVLVDTARGAENYLRCNSTNAQVTDSNRVSAFTSSGFTVGTDSETGGSGTTYVSWTFREQAKFFDVVTYTGDGSGTGRQISHSLGSTPGCIILKSTSTAGTNWIVYHRSLATNFTLKLQATDAAVSNAWISTVTDTYFTGSGTAMNVSGQTYVAYLWAHDAGGFPASGTGSTNGISCGSYTGNGVVAGPSVTLGYEPQWVLVKSSTVAGSNWFLMDNMRGMAYTLCNELYADLSAAEVTQSKTIIPTATGFDVATTDAYINNSGSTYIYIAIRRGPMKVPTDATKVFTPVQNSNFTAGVVISGQSRVDMSWSKQKDGANSMRIFDRLRGSSQFTNPSLFPNSTGAESNSAIWALDEQNGVRITDSIGTLNYINYFYTRAPSFFDEVCYDSNGVAGTQIPHNLGVKPELMIVKCRNNAVRWVVYAEPLGATKYLVLNSDFDAATSIDPWNNTEPTASVFTVEDGTQSNAGFGYTYVAYLFATCAGVSKVGSYTGTATTLQIDCGFTGGARFVLIKRTDSTGDWYVWDSARGIVAGNDPYLLLNSTAAEVTGTDYVDTYSAGFEISSTAPAAINASGGTYIFLAIA
jgi:hypothetical protein